MRRVAGVLTIIVSLLLVGFIRSAIPPFTPDEYEVLPDADGVARHEQYTVEVLGFDVADTLIYEREYETVRMETEHAFLVMRVRITPHQLTMLARVTLNTADGHEYQFIDNFKFSTLTVAHVGQTYTTSYFFELPRERIEGSWVGFHGQRADGIQPVWPILRFDVEEPGRHAEYVVPPPATEPAR